MKTVADGKPKVVIIGGGFGGLWAARALRNKPVDVTLIDRKNHHVFQPLLYQVATAVLSPGEIAQPIRRILHSARNIEVILGEAVAVDPKKQVVELSDGSQVAFDYAIVAARKVGLLEEPFPLVLTGGVLRHPSPLLGAALIERVHAAAPRARPVRGRFEPAAGAVLLALDLLHVHTDSALLARLEATLPGAAFFAT